MTKARGIDTTPSPIMNDVIELPEKNGVTSVFVQFTAL